MRIFYIIIRILDLTVAFIWLLDGIAKIIIIQENTLAITTDTKTYLIGMLYLAISSVFFLLVKLLDHKHLN